MHDLSVVRQAVATLEEISLRYHSPPELQGGDWRRVQIADRRLLFAAMEELAAASRRYLVACGDDARLRRLEENVTRFRHVLALHQANWPVVSIEQEDLGYLRSRQAVRVANRELASLMREILA